MSVAAKTWVEAHSPTRGTQRAVLVWLAWKADERGRGAYPTWGELEERVGRSRRTIARTINALRADGRIRRHEDCLCAHCDAARRRGAVVYDVVLGVDERVEAGQQTFEMAVSAVPNGTGATGCQECHGGTGRGATVTPLKDLEDNSLSLDQVRSESEFEEHRFLDETKLRAAPREGVRAREPQRKPVTYRGRTVPKATVRAAEHLLEVFNETVGVQLGARTGDGRPSQALKQIVGALIERPDEPADVWERGVQSMASDPPDWVDGRIMTGHIFGPKAAEHTLARGRGDTPTGRRQALTAADWDRIGDELEARGVAA